MKTIQITIDDDLLLKVDRATHLQKITRSQFIRHALEEVLRRMMIAELEQKQAEGYRQYPVTPGEFDVWESEQAWG
jgi:metal-responsive CopG/Arc/MetJ family transcriptional regulator